LVRLANGQAIEMAVPVVDDEPDVADYVRFQTSDEYFDATGGKIHVPLVRAVPPQPRKRLALELQHLVAVAGSIAPEVQGCGSARERELKRLVMGRRTFSASRGVNGSIAAARDAPSPSSVARSRPVCATMTDTPDQRFSTRLAIRPSPVCQSCAVTTRAPPGP